MNNNKNKKLNKIAEMLVNKNINKKAKKSNSDDILNKAGYFIENVTYGFIDITQKGRDVNFGINGVTLPVANKEKSDVFGNEGMSLNELPLGIFDSIVFKYNDHNNKEISLLELYPELDTGSSKLDLLGNMGLGLDEQFLEDDLDKQYTDTHLDIASKLNDKLSFKLVLFSDMDKYQRNFIGNTNFQKDDMSFKKKGFSLLTDTEFDLLGKTIDVSIASFRLESLYNNDDADIFVYSNEVQEKSWNNNTDKKVEGLKLDLSSELDRSTNITFNFTTSKLTDDYKYRDAGYRTSYSYDPGLITQDENGNYFDLTTTEGQEGWLLAYFNKWDNGTIYASSDATLTVAGNGLLDCYSLNYLLQEIFGLYNPNNTRVWSVSGALFDMICVYEPASCTVPTIDALDFATFKTWFYLRQNDQLPMYTNYGDPGTIPLDFFQVITEINKPNFVEADKINAGKKTITKNGVPYTKYPDMNYIIPRQIGTGTAPDGGSKIDFGNQEDKTTKNTTFKLDINRVLNNPVLKKVNVSYTNKIDEYLNCLSYSSSRIPDNLQFRESNFKLVNLNTSGKFPEMGSVYGSYIPRDFIFNNEVSTGEAVYYSGIGSGNLTINENVLGLNLKGNLLDIGYVLDAKYLLTNYDAEGTRIEYDENETETFPNIVNKENLYAAISSKEDDNLLISVEAMYNFTDKLDIHTKYYQSLDDINRNKMNTNEREILGTSVPLTQTVNGVLTNTVINWDGYILSESNITSFEKRDLQDVQIFDNYEIDLHYKFSKDLSLNANAYHTSGNISPSNTQYYYLLNSVVVTNNKTVADISYATDKLPLETQISGFNISVDVKDLNLGFDTKANIKTSLTYMDRIVSRRDNGIYEFKEDQFLNSYTLKLTSVLDLTKGDLKITPIITYNIPERYVEGGSTFSLDKQDIAVNLRGSYKFDNSLSANINIDNFYRSVEFKTNNETFLKEHFKPSVKAGIKKSF